MRTTTAALGSAAFFLVAPGTFAGLIPWLITGWQTRQPLPHWLIAQIVGLLLVGLGLVPVVSAFVEFVKAGGTPAPVAAPRRLVVSGFNRYVRNPMYVGLLAVIVGQALLFGSLGTVIYAAAMWAVTASFVRWYEEPTLRRQFGTEYQVYRQAVPAWCPRLRPWTPSPRKADTTR